MPVNSDKPHHWKEDIAKSVDFYNSWFIRFAPKAYRETRGETTQQVESTLEATSDLRDLSPAVLKSHPSILSILRMCTAPPIARDRLIGLSGVAPNLVRSMELSEKLPPRMTNSQITAGLTSIIKVFQKLLDYEIFPWLEQNSKPAKREAHRVATIVADRLCGAIADPIVRNAQEQRQLKAIETWLKKRGYTKASGHKTLTYDALKPGTFSFRLNIPVNLQSSNRKVNIPVDAVIKPKNSKRADFPILIEAKSAGDFTNTNKRRKEEAVKMSQLRANYGDNVQFLLFLCGYFDSGYLGYEAAEGIDWIWEHRIDDFNKIGV